MKRFASIAILTALAAGAGLGVAQAQLASGSSRSPIDASADTWDVHQDQCLTVLRGNAETIQDQNRLRARVINVFSRASARRPAAANGAAGGGNCGVLDHVVAEGDIYYITPTQTVKGDRAVYEADSDMVTVTGDVIVVQGQNVVRGEKLVINNKTGQANMESSNKGLGKPGRVRGVFFPEDKPAGAGAK